MDNTILFSNALIREEQTGKSQLKSVLVRDGIIIDIYDVGKTIESKYRVVNCEGKRLIPSFIDGHIHVPGDVLYRKYGLVLYNCASVDKLLKTLVEYKTAHDSSNCIRGFGWDYSILDEINNSQSGATIKEKVDRVFDNIPVVLSSADNHMHICNSFALNIIKSTMQPSDYDKIVLRDENGEPNGFLLKGANQIIAKHPALCFSLTELEESFLEYQSILHRYGITAIQSLMFIGGDNDKEWRILKKLNQQGLLKLNINGSIPVEPNEPLNRIQEDYQQKKAFEDDKIKICTAKIYIDGVIENHTACLFAPYSDTKNKTSCFWSEKELNEMCVFLHRLGLQIHAHAIGDRAAEMATRAFIYAQKHTSQNYRNVIAHLQLCRIHTIRKMAKNSILACVHPYWFLASDYYFTIDKKRLGKRAEYEYRLGSLVKNGVIVTCGSDSPVTSDFCPTIAMSYGATRLDKELDGRSFNKRECSEVSEIVQMFTKNGAYQLFRDNQIGYIMPGYSADFVILSDDVYSVPASDVKRIRPVKTVFRGEIVYDENAN